MAEPANRIPRADPASAIDQKLDYQRLLEAIELSRCCIPSNGAFSVGALLFDRAGRRIATGYSRETSPVVHAEEVALARAAAAGVDLKGGSLYSSLEPCGRRLSGRLSCAERLIAAGIGRVVFALREPAVFVAATGATRLREAGIEVVTIPELGPAVEDVNRHLHGVSHPDGA